MKFITKEMHAFLDYPVAITLIIFPFLLNLGEYSPIAFQFSVVTGIVAFILTLITDHHLGVFRVLPYEYHLIVDSTLGVVFISAPFVFSLEGLNAYYYWIIGGAVLTVVGLNKPELALE